MGKKKKVASCKCVANTNKKLREKGLRLDSVMSFSFGIGTAAVNEEAPLVKLEWLELKKRKKPPVLTCQFCPFCGAKKG